jgi:hypothetical protein
MLVIVGEFADIRVDEALLHEQGFQRLDSQRRVGRRIGMIVIGHGDVSQFLFVAGREREIPGPALRAAASYGKSNPRHDFAK